MSANKFVLKHHKIEIDYTVGITPGLPALIYKDGPAAKTFKNTDIATEETAVGLLVLGPPGANNRHGRGKARFLLTPT